LLITDQITGLVGSTPGLAALGIVTRRGLTAPTLRHTVATAGKAGRGAAGAVPILTGIATGAVTGGGTTDIGGATDPAGAVDGAGIGGNGDAGRRRGVGRPTRRGGSSTARRRGVGGLILRLTHWFTFPAIGTWMATVARRTVSIETAIGIGGAFLTTERRISGDWRGDNNQSHHPYYQSS